MHDGPLMFINYCSPGGWWSLAPPLEHRLCFVFATGDSRRVGGAAWVSGLVELLLLLLGCLALLGAPPPPVPGRWDVEWILSLSVGWVTIVTFRGEIRISHCRPTSHVCLETVLARVGGARIVRGSPAWGWLD